MEKPMIIKSEGRGGIVYEYTILPCTNGFKPKKKMKSYKSYNVTLSDAKGEHLVHKSFRKFNKHEIQEEINTMSCLMEEGYEIEYWKTDHKYAYIPMYTIVMKNGKFKQEIVKGEKVY
jgi:hypothetical protein